MNRTSLLGSLVLGLAVCTQGFGFELLDRMLGASGCGCEARCCETSCCKSRCHRNRCCNDGCNKGCGAIAPGCVAAAPTCAAPAAPTCAAPAAPACGLDAARRTTVGPIFAGSPIASQDLAGCASTGRPGVREGRVVVPHEVGVVHLNRSGSILGPKVSAPVHLTP